MTGAMKLPDPTTGLWLANAFGISLLLLIVAYQFGGAFFGLGAQLPPVLPLVVQPVPQPGLEANAGSRNPFDSSSAHWKTSSGKTAASGELRGVILLPGVQAVVTSSGAVHLGETLTGGRVAKILDDKVVVEQENGNREMELPSAHRPTLRSLNKANSGQDIFKGTK